MCFFLLWFHPVLQEPHLFITCSKRHCVSIGFIIIQIDFLGVFFSYEAISLYAKHLILLLSYSKESTKTTNSILLHVADYCSIAKHDL